MITEKSRTIRLSGHAITFYNQHSMEWTHPYDGNGRNIPLRESGCGIFALCHCAQWLTGREQSPEYWADAAVSLGAVEECGTIRSVLLRGLMNSGAAAELGFSYDDEGTLNDKELLFSFLMAENGVAMGNVHSGHIVAVAAARKKGESKQLLIIDSAAESCDAYVRQKITEVLPESQVHAVIRNQRGVMLGEVTGYGCYWVDASAVHSFHLLHKIDQGRKNDTLS